MPLIKPRTRGKHIVENNETLFAYAQFIAESTDYVLNQLLDGVLSKDKEFVTWRADHPQSFVPRPTVATKTAKRPGSPSEGARALSTTGAGVAPLSASRDRAGITP
jgi:hypothetical protein